MMVENVSKVTIAVSRCCLNLNEFVYPLLFGKYLKKNYWSLKIDVNAARAARSFGFLYSGSQLA